MVIGENNEVLRMDAKAGVRNMRDKNRIKPFCDELAELWSNYPDMRFGQIMTVVRLEQNKDMFYMEDDELMAILRKQLRKL